MIKKAYLRPTTNVVEVKSARLVCTSLSGVNSTGLGDNETLDYGDTSGNKEKSIWDMAW